MVKDSILFKIFIRYLKEKGWFNEYKKCMPSTYFTILEKRCTSVPCSLLGVFKITDWKDQYEYNISEINKLINNINNVNEFNDIINSYLKDYCISFIEEYDLLEIFTKALVTAKTHAPIPFIKPHYKNIYDKENQYNILNAYLNSYLKTKYSLFNFINYAFTWAETNNGHHYWCDMHKLLKQYLWGKLLNKKK